MEEQEHCPDFSNFYRTVINRESDMINGGVQLLPIST